MDLQNLIRDAKLEENLLCHQSSEKCTIKFGGREFNFYINRNLPGPEYGYGSGIRDAYHHTPFEPITDKLQEWDILKMIMLFKKQIEWKAKVMQKISLPGTINKVGENSRHIIFDKNKGLKMFYGWPDSAHGVEVPTDTEVTITYEADKITIEKADPHKKDWF